MVEQEGQIAEAMKVILSKFVDNPAKVTSIDAGTSLRDGLGISSVNVIELLLAIEEEFGVSVDDEEISGIVTFRDCVSLVCGKRTGTALGTSGA